METEPFFLTSAVFLLNTDFQTCFVAAGRNKKAVRGPEANVPRVHKVENALSNNATKTPDKEEAAAVSTPEGAPLSVSVCLYLYVEVYHSLCVFVFSLHLCVFPSFS